jgi:O-acetyl-ADP-ribose deacetylase (regulator of RNase III)
MIEYLKPYDITQVTNGVVMHGCNAHGVMGSGVAKVVRAKWPLAYERYHAFCKGYEGSPDLMGKVVIVNVTPEDGPLNSLFIANAITQQNYGRDGKVYASTDAIADALATTVAFASALDLPVFLPPIGCGLGGLNWDQDVKSLVEWAATGYPINIFVCDI